MIVWVVAGVLALATGLRIGWALVNRQSVVSSAMIVALGSLAVLAALNWPPLTLLIDTASGHPNLSVALSQVALVASAAGSCVMIISVATGTADARRFALLQYGIATVVAAVTLIGFLRAEPLPEMAPQEYLNRSMQSGIGWLLPLLYVMLAMTLVSWVGLRLSNPSRRGRALFLFSAGTGLIVGAVAFLLFRTVGTMQLAGIGIAAAVLLCALAIVGSGALLPTVQDWLDARQELRIIEPLLQEMQRRHPEVGIGIRPRGPLVFRVAEQLSLISDALYLETMLVAADGTDGGSAPEPGFGASEQARAVAQWIHAGREDAAVAFPGRDWIRQPHQCSDREWILEIARQYRSLREDSDLRATAGG